MFPSFFGVSATVIARLRTASVDNNERSVRLFQSAASDRSQRLVPLVGKIFTDKEDSKTDRRLAFSFHPLGPFFVRGVWLHLERRANLDDPTERGLQATKPLSCLTPSSCCLTCDVFIRTGLGCDRWSRWRCADIAADACGSGHTKRSKRIFRKMK